MNYDLTKSEQEGSCVRGRVAVKRWCPAGRIPIEPTSGTGRSNYGSRRHLVSTMRSSHSYCARAQPRATLKII